MSMAFLQIYRVCYGWTLTKPSSTVPIFKSYTKCTGSPGIIHDRTHDCHQVSWAWIHDDLTAACSSDSQAMGAIDVLGLFFDMLSMDVCTTRHWHTSGRLVQELNVCSVGRVIGVHTCTCNIATRVCYFPYWGHLIPWAAINTISIRISDANDNLAPDSTSYVVQTIKCDTVNHLSIAGIIR